MATAAPPPAKVQKVQPPRDNMQLYATGFNAWNQLILEPTMVDKADPDDIDPDDLYSFTKVLSAQDISNPVGHLGFTVVNRDGTPWMAGGSAKDCAPLDASPDSELNCIHAICDLGLVLTIQESKSEDGNVTQTLVGYPSVTDWKIGRGARSWPLRSPVRQIAAYKIGFVLLHEDQESPVSTIGEPRFQECLGRHVDDSNPVDQPCSVPLLSDLGEPIKKVTANGYNLAALTEGGAVYIWGTRVKDSPSQYYPFPNIEGIPNYVQVDGDKDVMDVALGENHAIAMTTDGCVYVIGDNGNGQLGLGTGFTGVAESWTKVDFQVPGSQIVGVEAGPKSSFILTAKERPK